MVSFGGGGVRGGEREGEGMVFILCVVFKKRRGRRKRKKKKRRKKNRHNKEISFLMGKIIKIKEINK